MSAAKLSRRERQIMDVLYRQGKASVGEVQEALPEPPAYSTVRALLRIMVDKGLVAYEDDGTRYLYAPTQPRQNAAVSALRQVVQTFFGGSAEQAVATLLSESEVNITDEELQRLALLIEEAQHREARPASQENKPDSHEAKSVSGEANLTSKRRGTESS